MDATLPTRVALQLWGELRSVDEHGAPIELSNPRARACLAREGLVPDTHLVLADHGVKKRRHADFDAVEAARIYEGTVRPAAGALQDTNHADIA